MWALRFATLTLLALGFAQGGKNNQASVSEKMMKSVMDMCFPAMPMQHLNYLPDRHMQVFTEFEFSCAGEVAAWNFYANQAGHFFAAVWRKHPDGRLELIGKNYVSAADKGVQTYFVPGHLRFKVKAGDVLGIHYEDKSGKAIVRFEDNYHKSNADPTIALSATVGIDKVYNEGLPVGHVLTTADQHSHKGKRAPALFPVFNRNRLRLDGGQNAMEGRAMFFSNGEWGTICDDKFWKYGWPTVFCKELGYDHCEMSEDASAMYTGKGKGHIGYMKPSCPKTGNVFMDECKKTEGTCTHGQDVFVRCAYHTKLEGGKKEGEGRAMSFDTDKEDWGTICDLWPVASAWASTLCHELGYSHAAIAEKATDSYVGKGKGKINLKNPTCEATKPYHLKYCAKSRKDCGHSKDVFVKCQRGVRLVSGKAANEGIAQVYRQNQWGSVCLDSVQRDKFPSVFCKELGYDLAESVSYAKNAYTGKASGLIGEMNPECGPEDAANTQNCGHPSPTGCTHEKDVFIKCTYNNLCKLKPCQNQGICIPMENDYKCECIPGYGGPNCEQNIDDCAKQPCLNGGTCVDLINDFRCECEASFIGRRCQYADLPKGPVVIHAFGKPSDSVNFVPFTGNDEKNTPARLTADSVAFKIIPGLTKTTGTVSFVSANKDKYYLRAFSNALSLEGYNGARNKQSFRMDASFYPEPSTNHSSNFILRCVSDETLVLVFSGEDLLIQQEKPEDKDFMDRANFFFHDLDAQNSLIMYSANHFEGQQIILTEDDSDFRNHQFDNKLNSFEIKGASAWQLFEHRDFNGKSVIAQPGKYDIEWVNSHIGHKNIISSARKVDITDGLILWQKDDFTGKHLAISASDSNIAKRQFIKTSRSVEVIGPSSWELYSTKDFKGTKVVVAPGRYPASWLDQHLQVNMVMSAKKVEVNLAKCSASSGAQKMAGRSGEEHDVFVLHKQDGSVWLRFGEGDMEKKWNKNSVSAGVFRRTIIDESAVAAMKDFDFIGWDVETDVKMQMSVDNSWHPSKIDVMYLGSRAKDTLSFVNTFSDRTDITFAADKSQVACSGRVQNGKVLSNLCGQNGLPQYGTSSSPLVITSVDMRPRGLNSYATNKDFSRSAFTWKGSYYYVYAKLADCASSTGCYKRQEGVSYVYGRVEAQKDSRPNTFYFGNLGSDIDACEAACKDESECVAYTLYKESDTMAGDCYGVGKSQLGEPVQQEGALSGKSMECGSFIPEYMDNDMWTRNTTSCPCKFDTSRTDCACCHEGACQCEHRYKYQCTLCGFSDRCGAPFLTTNDHEYTFEYKNQQLNSVGRHYNVPDLCVTGCSMEVRGTGSAASEVSAHMTDFNDNRKLSCVASGLDTTKDALVDTVGATEEVEGARVSRINLYAHGGMGEMVQLKLKVNKAGCKQVEKDPRYVGCFTKDVQVKDENSTDSEHIPSMTSTHMTKALCVQQCYNSGFNYAMMEMGTTCECANTKPAAGASFTCDMFCSGDSRQVCGGRAAQSVFMTKFKEHTIVVAAAPGGCPALGGIHISSIPVMASGDECKKLSGAQTSGSDIVQCDMDWCGVDKIVDGGLFGARPGSCGDRKRGEIFVRTSGVDCLDMGGSPNYPQITWGMCQIDLCTSAVPRSTIFVPATLQSCPAHVRIANFELNSTVAECRKMGGSLYDTNMPAQNMTSCLFEMCVVDKRPMQNNLYTFPHNNEVMSAGAVHTFTIPAICVTECSFSFDAAEGLSIAEVTAVGAENKEAGLFCGGMSPNGTKDVLSFADKATGVLISGLQISAQNHSFILNHLKLRINPDGCKNDEDMVVIYDQPNFGGRPTVIKDDLADLDTVQANNIASSFKIYGNMMWELFENKDWKGRSAVLSEGQFYDTASLPFGDDHLSSIHKVATFDANMEQTRKDISNARGLVCFKRTPKSSAVFGLPPNGPKSEDRPRVFYFGEYGNDIDSCERACRAEPQCAAFTQVSTKGPKDWAGQCYGRSFRDDIRTYMEDVMSGYVAPCQEEDTLTLYTDKEFNGAAITIIEDMVNTTFSAGPLSAMVTGKDTWRVLSESEGHIHTYKLSVGEYSDLSLTITGNVFQVSKLHPNTQLYDAQHNQIDLAPVAFNQIQKTITRTRVKVGETETTETGKVCNTTEAAEIFFVIDASSSIRDYNYVKVLDFAAKVSESFKVSNENVRVGAIIFSYHEHLDIKLGDQNDAAGIEAAIRGLTYYKGGTYTHKALKLLREDGLSISNSRPGLSRQAIVITDGKSRLTDETKNEAHLCRDDGIVLTSVGIKSADYQELFDIAGDASRVYNVSDFDKLAEIVTGIEKTTCTAVEQGNTVWNYTEHVSITVQGDDSNYFIQEEHEFTRKPVALGMESGVIYDSQIFASSSLIEYEAGLARLNHNSGWITTEGNHTNGNEWIEVDLGKIMPVHGIATQGHAIEASWVTKYKIAISLDGIHFVTFKDTNTTMDLIFMGNTDQNTIKYHCLHRLFGQAISLRVIRFIIVEWEIRISMRIELYGYRDANDPQLVEILRKDVWTRNVTGCPCYYDPTRKDCACCEDGGCQCPNTDRHQCVQCGYPHNCGTPSLRNPVNNIDGWTSSLSGCRCAFDRQRTDCACCQSYGCQCGAGNKNQCVNCGHPEHCGLKEHIFGPNPYCLPQTCPRKINVIWEGPAPEGVNPGESNPVIKEVSGGSALVGIIKKTLTEQNLIV